jgi:acetyl esterase/lipase
MPINRRAFLGMSGAAALAGRVQAPDSKSVKIEKDVVFGKGGQTDLHCDIYRPPAGAEKRMALIHIHGGGFARGTKDNMGGQIIPITSRGYLSIAVEYRLSAVAKWPAPIHDVKAAIRWTRSNAGSLGIDPQRIAVVGHSAGGHLALFAAGTANRAEFEGESGTPKAGTDLAACIAFYPVTVINAQSYAPALLPAGSDEAANRAASPTTYVSKTFPPTLLFHGLADVTVAPESSQRFLQLLRDAGVPSELHTFAGVPHEFDEHPEFAQACAELIDFFLDRQVLHPRTYPPFQPGAPRK